MATDPTKWEVAGHCDVDAGCIMIGDPCYYLHKDDNDSKEDVKKWQQQFGKNWHGFCDIILKHRPYTLTEAKEFVRKYKKDCAKEIAEDDVRFKKLVEGSKKYDKKFFDLYKHIGWRGTVNRWLKEGLYIQTTQINHPLGHPGAAVVMNSGYGDGSYPVYVRRNEEGRIAEATIVFIDSTHPAIQELEGDDPYTDVEDEDE